MTSKFQVWGIFFFNANTQRWSRVHCGEKASGHSHSESNLALVSQGYFLPSNPTLAIQSTIKADRELGPKDMPHGPISSNGEKEIREQQQRND